MHVANVESRSVAAQSTRSESGQTSLVRQLSQRVRLIHELRQLAAAKELANGSHHRPRRANQPLRRHCLRVLNRHTLPDSSLEALEAGSHMHLNQLTDRTDASVAE